MIAFLAVLVGANTVLCRYLNAIYAKRNGLSMGTLINYITGLATALLVLLVFGDPMAVQPIGALSLRKIMMFLGGAVGVVMIQILIYITPRMPAFLGTMMIFISQLGAGLALDYAFTGTLSLSKLLGGILVLLG
ncbi:MAG: DMT family transporter, partial [Eubacteriales bacterium]|nr:DMT family transporter [Eubacteriales bacterium]